MRPPSFDTAELSLVRTPFDDDNFLFELKHDGFRALAHIWDGRCELISRKRNAYKSFQALRDNLSKLKVKNAVIDGELVCLDSEGRSIFNELLFRRGCPIFYAFDLLYLNDRALRQLPLIERKEKLKGVIEKSAVPDIVCGKYVEGRGVDLFNGVCRLNLEGVIAKRKTGIYATVSGWLKIKNLYIHSRNGGMNCLILSKRSKKNFPQIPKKPPVRSRPLKARRAKKASSD